jgi:DNA-directed RNA polymerase subunit RPC12/RpoP
MSPIGPKPHIKEVKPQVIYTSVTCPYCGAENKIPQNKIQISYICSSCGEKVDLIGGKTSSPT